MNPQWNWDLTDLYGFYQFFIRENLPNLCYPWSNSHRISRKIKRFRVKNFITSVPFLHIQYHFLSIFQKLLQNQTSHKTQGPSNEHYTKDL